MPGEGFPLPPTFDSKIFPRKDLDSNLDTQSVRFGISVWRIGPEERAHVGRLTGTIPEGGTPSPPAFDSKIFSGNDLDSNRDMRLIWFDISCAE